MREPPDDAALETEPGARPAFTPPERSVASDQGRELFAHWFGALVTTGLFGSVAVGILVGEIRTEPFFEWLLLGIAALAPILLVRAVIETVRWMRFRSVVLELDPAPGSLAGHVGGRILLPLRRLRPEQCSVSLSCIRVRKGSESTFESIVWSAERTPWVSFGSGGMEVSFAFSLPSDLAPSDPDGEVKWAVRLVGDVPGLDLDLSFPIQVVQTPEPLRSSVEVIPEAEAGSWGGRDARLGPGIGLERKSGALVFRYGMRRSLAMGIALGVFGAVFLGSGVFIFRTLLRDLDSVFGLIFLSFGGLFLLVFGLVGLGLLLIGLNLIFTTRCVEVSPSGLTVRWRFLLLASERTLRLEEVERIAARVMGQVGQGAKASVRYEIKAHLVAGGSVILGDGIRGAAHLDRIVNLIERETGRTVELERKRDLRRS